MNQDNINISEEVSPKYVKLIDCMGDDLTVCNSARVSFNKKSSYKDLYPRIHLKEEDEKLIKYLAKHGHWTPFSQVQFQFRIKMPIAIARQYFKSQIGFTRNEISRRYVSYNPEYFIPKIFRERPEENIKQGSGAALKYSYELKVKKAYLTHCKNCDILYRSMIDDFNIAPEQARLILPQCIMTEFIETGSLAAYARLINLRMDQGAQKEIQEYAHLLSKEIKKLCPVSWKYLIGVKNE